MYNVPHINLFDQWLQTLSTSYINNKQTPQQTVREMHTFFKNQFKTGEDQ